MAIHNKPVRFDDVHKRDKELHDYAKTINFTEFAKECLEAKKLGRLVILKEGETCLINRKVEA